jgi:hypothetical protein
MFDDLPPSAGWRHHAARTGFETVFMGRTRQGWRFDGHTAAVEDDRPWTVRYRIAVDSRWHTRRARVWLWSEFGELRRTITTDGSGRWEVDGRHASDLDGCLDVDLESSACTNTFPVHRLAGPVDARQDAPAAFVRVADLRVERLEQGYVSRGEGVYDYEAPVFDFTCRLRYDRSGLVVDYPGIAVRLH